MVVNVSRHPPAVVVNGLRIETAPLVTELLRVIGTPTRVETGPRAAPPGFRNNQQHVFDLLGVHVNEHHQTRRAQEIGIALSVGERRFGFTPASAFAGTLDFGGVRMPLNADETEFLKLSPWPFVQLIAGSWYYDFDGYSVGFDAVGAKLASGRRSKQRVVIAVSISWPHDPRGEPAGGT